MSNEAARDQVNDTSRSNDTSTNQSSNRKSIDKKDQDCQTCVQLLQHVLFSNATNSSKLLQSIATSSSSESLSSSSSSIPTDDSHDNVRIIPNGVQVRIPHRQKKVNNNKYSVDDPFKVLATTTAASTRSPMSYLSANSSQKNDWIDVTCRKCSDFGPEANARAFVMGPIPLSIVICHNRLSSATVNAKSTKPIWSELKSRLSTATSTKNVVSAIVETAMNDAGTATTTIASTNSIAMIREMDEIITHELIHIYDVRQLHLNLMHCNDLAYSEIRAAREAECYTLAVEVNSSNKQRSNTNNNHKEKNVRQSDQLQLTPLQDCVSTRATTATKNIFSSRQAKECIRNVYYQAMADLRPFKNNTNQNFTTVECEQEQTRQQPRQQPSQK
jgi:Peptidase M76 family